MENESAKDKANRAKYNAGNQTNTREKQAAVKENDREQFDKSFTDNGTKFSLGTEGEYMGFAYGAAVKIRSKDVKYDNEFKQYTLKMTYSTMARFIAWLMKDENKVIFNELVKAEKLKNEGTPELA
ncbi:MAG: hypothetical protein MPEBLZ_04377 [Candidatus Methanoperedens nitroreducens]|uniref:Uncharacterized protein n=1 Tax=Candidatus Methanoperedens nitratireducens TaxID=1392998 RepID=A0A0P7Z9V8_9EURY|nr:MAG: hypothetical protein F9K14_03255 [Candidatus Methanoperedens sp.]KPQ41063.1 MAG: hypothetical protein MPEBLZ_04377 [Candidatus Methanoperedens sp. BLZ1]MBZ0175249.1 hypothetical protein [Candidatus Methanoperedens nitroreducens]MCX9076523.1 hypothetical protein [Candidatus Methanoperedens sp.]